MSLVFSETMGNMLRSAQMLCGSFESEDMTEVEKEERRLMNDAREAEVLKEVTEEAFNVEMFDTWIKMLVSKMVLEELVDETGALLAGK